MAASKVKKPAPSRRKPESMVGKLRAMGLDEICRRIASGESSAAIAASVGMSRAYFSIWLSEDQERADRVRAAMTLSARHWDEQAAKVLEEADPTLPGSIAKAREIAQHYRWRAKCYAPKQYGDQLKLDADVKVQMTEDQVEEKLTYLLGKAKV